MGMFVFPQDRKRSIQDLLSVHQEHYIQSK